MKILNPLDAATFSLAGLVMAMSVVSSITVASGSTDGMTSMTSVVAATAGCSLAWGIIDALLLIMGQVGRRAHANYIISRIKSAANQDEVEEIIGEILPKEITRGNISNQLYTNLLSNLSETKLSGVKKSDFLSGLAVVSVYVAATVPVTLPLLMIEDPWVALRMSNLATILCLFATGVFLGKWSGIGPWKVGISSVIFGVLMTALCILLGG